MDLSLLGIGWSQDVWDGASHRAVGPIVVRGILVKYRLLWAAGRHERAPPKFIDQGKQAGMGGEGRGGH